MSSPATRVFMRLASSKAASARAAANAATATVGKKSATSSAASPSPSVPVSLPKTFVRRSAPGCKETTEAHVKEASAPRGSLWEKMFF